MQALELAKMVMSANSCCAPEDFHRDHTTIVEAGLCPGRMPFHLGRPHLSLVTFGANVVVSVSAEWMNWARRVARGLVRDEIFSMPCLARIERHMCTDRVSPS